MGDFSLLPSLIVLGLLVAALVVVSTVLRRRGRRRPAPEIGRAPARVPVDELAQRAAIQLVQMDDSIRAAEEELQFARAEFGDAAAHDFGEALATARRRAAEAFALKQRLDDAVPDTEQEQRDWSKRILALSDSALALVTAQSRQFDERRRAETSAAESLRVLAERVRIAQSRVADARHTLTELAGTYDHEASAALTDNPDRAETAFARAEEEVQTARTEVERDPLAPIARRTRAAEAALGEGTALLDAVTRLPADLTAASATLRTTLDEARRQLDEAARLRDLVENASAVERIAAAMETLRTAVTAAESRVQGNPRADLDRLAAARASLDDTVSVARSAQQRLDAARDALAGALQIAESHIGTADDYISSRRGRVGADARTRLAAARRELDLARLEADPLAALDGARRAATLATDADALARYDTLGAR